MLLRNIIAFWVLTSSTILEFKIVFWSKSLLSDNSSNRKFLMNKVSYEMHNVSTLKIKVSAPSPWFDGRSSTKFRCCMNQAWSRMNENSNPFKPSEWNPAQQAYASSCAWSRFSFFISNFDNFKSALSNIRMHPWKISPPLLLSSRFLSSHSIVKLCFERYHEL